MQHNPEDILQIIDKTPAGSILCRMTGKEEVDLPAHSHNRHQLIYIISGTLHITDGMTEHFVTEGHLAWIPAGQHHRLSSFNRQISLLVCYFSLPDHPSPPRFAIYHTDDFIFHNLSFIAGQGLLDDRHSGSIHAFALGFLKILPDICTEAKFPTLPVFREDNRLRPILRYIERNLSRDLSIGSVAAEFGFSVRNLTRLFTGCGISFLQFLQRQRVIRSIEILSERKLTVEQVAYEVGFSSANSFCRVFRNITGHPPSRFFPKVRGVTRIP